MSDYEQRFQAAIDETKRAGIWRRNANPPYVRRLRQLGFELRPPHYVPFLKIMIRLGTFFGLLFGVLIWVVYWNPQNLPGLLAIAFSVFAGAFFGLFMALYFAFGRKRHNLNRWEDLLD